MGSNEDCQSLRASNDNHLFVYPSVSFYENTRNYKIEDNIRNGCYRKLPANLNFECRHLIHHMLRKSTNGRPTAAECLKHPFFSTDFLSEFKPERASESYKNNKCERCEDPFVKWCLIPYKRSWKATCKMCGRIVCRAKCTTKMTTVDSGIPQVDGKENVCHDCRESKNDAARTRERNSMLQKWEMLLHGRVDYFRKLETENSAVYKLSIREFFTGQLTLQTKDIEFENSKDAFVDETVKKLMTVFRRKSSSDHANFWEKSQKWVALEIANSCHSCGGTGLPTPQIPRSVSRSRRSRYRSSVGLPCQ